MNRSKCTISFLLLSWALGLSCEASQELQTTRGLVERWVAVEETLSQEEIAWEEKRTSLLDLIKVSEAERSNLEQELTRIRESATKADEERLKLVEEGVEIERSAKRIRSFLEEIETQLVALRKRLPSPLQRSLEPLFSRFPENPKATNMGIAERMQTVVTALSSIATFDDKVTVDLEIRSLANGTMGEVTTLWIGLGAAYYIDEASEDAGYGVAGQSGWEWVSDPRLKDSIAEAVALAEGSTQEARFIELPVKVSVN